MNNQEKNTIIEFATSISFTVEYSTNYGVMLNGPEYNLYIYNEGSGWDYDATEGGTFTESWEEAETVEELLDMIDIEEIDRIYAEANEMYNEN